MLFPPISYTSNLRIMKTSQQRVTEKILLLHILDQDNNIFSKLKLQKEVFLIELKFAESGVGGLYYKFFKYNYGPYSKELAIDCANLANLGLIHKSTFKLTERGKSLIKYVEEATGNYKNNGKVLEILRKCLFEYKLSNGKQLMKLVYDLEIEPENLPGEIMKIKHVPIFLDLIVPEYCSFNWTFEIRSEILTDIVEELSMDEDAWNSLETTHKTAIAQATKNLADAVLKDPPLP